MKKTMKKLLSLTLCVVMLMSVMGIQSFAALDYLFTKPEVQSVALSEKSTQVFSVKELKEYYDTVDEVIAYYNEVYEENYTIETLPDDLRDWILNYYLSDSMMPYELDVTFTDGKTVTVDSYDEEELGNNYYVSADGWITYDDYLDAVKNNKNTVKLTYTVEVYSLSAFSDYDKEYTFDSKVDLVDCFVKKLTPVSGVPSKICEDADYIDLNGAKFTIVYADGTKKTATVTTGDEIDEFILDGNNIYAYEDESVIYIHYQDETYEKKISYKAFPFEKIEFVNYEYTDKDITVEYKVTRTNGKVYEYTKTLPIEVVLSDALDGIEGFYVTLTTYNDSYEEQEDEALKFYICIGELYSNGLEVEIELPEELKFFEKIVEKIQEIIEFFRNLIESLLSKIGPAA